MYMLVKGFRTFANQGGYWTDHSIVPEEEGRKERIPEEAPVTKIRRLDVEAPAEPRNTHLNANSNTFG